MSVDSRVHSCMHQLSRTSTKILPVALTTIGADNTDDFQLKMSTSAALPLLRPPVPALSVLGKRRRPASSTCTPPTQIINGQLTSLVTAEAHEGLPSSYIAASVDADSDSDAEVENLLMGKSGREATHVDEDDDDGAVSDGEAVATSSSAPRPPAKRSKTRFHCQWEGCDKSYTKPVRLEEHVRSHTGERPFVCTFDGCTASYLRDTHLTAHLRTHRKDEEKPLACTESSCDKRFWTNQHLNRHIKLVHDNTKTAYEVRWLRQPLDIQTDLLPTAVRSLRRIFQ